MDRLRQLLNLFLPAERRRGVDVETGHARDRRRRGEQPTRLLRTISQADPEQRQVDGVSGDSRPDRTGARATAGQDAEAAQDLAQPQCAQGPARARAVLDPDQSSDLLRRGDLGEAERQTK